MPQQLIRAERCKGDSESEKQLTYYDGNYGRLQPELCQYVSCFSYSVGRGFCPVLPGAASGQPQALLAPTGQETSVDSNPDI